MSNLCSSNGASVAWSIFSYLLLILGAVELTRAAFRASKGTYVYFLRPGKSIKSYGPWAVVTGATDGIGRAYADALAKKGLNVVLISRTLAKLEAAASDIQNKFRVETKVLAADFSSLDESTLSSIQQLLGSLNIGILVNNVGLSYDHAEYLDQIDNKLIDDLIQINIVAATKIARLAIPGMKQRKQPSAIVNIGSAAATVAPSGPLYAVYAGSKAYIDMFSKSLDLEYKKFGISIQNQAPMYVATKMSKIRRPTLDAPSPKTWVASAIKHIGYESTSCPYWYHGLLWGVASSLPVWVMDAYLLKFHTGLRERYYRKKAREAKNA